MKRYLFTLLFVSCALFSFAQSHRYYCEIKGYEKGVKSKLKIIYDFGDKVSKANWNCKSRKVKFVDENGKKINFNSVVDAANFMAERGWIFDQAYSADYSTKKSIKHWIFYKEASSLEEVKEGLMTKKDYNAAKNAAKKAEKAKKNVVKKSEAKKK